MKLEGLGVRYTAAEAAVATLSAGHSEHKLEAAAEQGRHAALVEERQQAHAAAVAIAKLYFGRGWHGGR